MREMGSMLQGHPDTKTPGVDAYTGSLGQGLSIAVGMALAARIDKADYKIYVLLGDGELKEKLIDMTKKLKIENLVNFVGFKNNPQDFIA